jgi:hypothetical protein
MGGEVATMGGGVATMGGGVATMGGGVGVTRSCAPGAMIWAIARAVMFAYPGVAGKRVVVFTMREIAGVCGAGDDLDERNASKSTLGLNAPVESEGVALGSGKLNPATLTVGTGGGAETAPLKVGRGLG